MIRVNENYVIDADAHSFTLYLDQGKKREADGRELPARKILGYYGSLTGALQGIVDAEVRKCTAEGEKSLETALTELVTALEKVKADITGAVPTVHIVEGRK